MNYVNFLRSSFRILLFCFILTLSFLPAIYAVDNPSEKKPDNHVPDRGLKTDDDLFKFLVDEWANKIEYSMFEGSVATGEPIIGLKKEPNYKEALENFGKKIIESENIYGHLPEYWQLRSQIDLDNGLDWIQETKGGYVWSPFANRVGDLRHNADHLRKSFEIDPSNGEVKWFLGKLDIENKFPDRLSLDDPDKIEKYTEYYKLNVQFNADAAAVNPDNAFYPLYEAVYNHKLGKFDLAMESLKRAGACTTFYIPRIFPSNYAMNHIYEFEMGKMPFENMTPGGKYYLFMNFFDGADALPNYIIIKNMYRDIIADSHDDENWCDTLNILHKAACVLGKGEGNETVNHLVAIALVKLCLVEAQQRVNETGDIDLERAVIAASSETKLPKKITSYKLQDDKMMYRFLYSMLIDQLNQDLGIESLPGKAYSKILPPQLEKRHFWMIHETQIKPVFEELETFDYNNPKEWYDNWKTDMFPDLYKDDSDQ